MCYILGIKMINSNNNSVWLIEKKDSGGRCLGECTGVLKFTTPELAIHYARRKDAESSIRTYGLVNVTCVEHIFS